MNMPDGKLPFTRQQDGNWYFRRHGLNAPLRGDPMADDEARVRYDALVNARARESAEFPLSEAARSFGSSHKRSKLAPITRMAYDRALARIETDLGHIDVRAIEARHVAEAVARAYGDTPSAGVASAALNAVLTHARGTFQRAGMKTRWPTFRAAGQTMRLNPADLLLFGRREAIYWALDEAGIDRGEAERDAPSRDFCGDRTAVYRHFNADGVLLYVGIARSVTARLSGHKDSPWDGEIASITVEWFDTRADALAAEIEAIRKEAPMHNVAGAVSGAERGTRG